MNLPLARWRFVDEEEQKHPWGFWVGSIALRPELSPHLTVRGDSQHQLFQNNQLMFFRLSSDPCWRGTGLLGSVDPVWTYFQLLNKYGLMFYCRMFWPTENITVHSVAHISNQTYVWTACNPHAQQRSVYDSKDGRRRLWTGCKVVESHHGSFWCYVPNFLFSQLCGWNLLLILGFEVNTFLVPLSESSINKYCCIGK